MYVKGAPEAVLARCVDGSELRCALEAANERAAAGALVLAVAADASPGSGDLAPDPARHALRVLGLVAISDPPRADALSAIEASRRAGVEVKMITDDHVATARAISRQLDMAGGEALTGQRLDELDDDALASAAERASTFARVAPEHSCGSCGHFSGGATWSR